MTELDPSTEDLARALRAPGTATELQDEERYLAMFREANGAPPPPVRSLPRRVGRLGAGGTAVVVTVALTSGVAAAYTGHLPDPVQELAHSVIGAPAPDSGPTHHHGRTAAAAGDHPLPPAVVGTGTVVVAGTLHRWDACRVADADPRLGLRQSPHVADRGDRWPGRLADPEPSSSGSASALPSALTLSATTHRVAVGEGVTFTGQLTDVDGAALPDHPAVLQVRGPQRWRRSPRPPPTPPALRRSRRRPCPGRRRSGGTPTTASTAPRGWCSSSRP